MRISRMTLVLPARLAPAAEREARQIAQAAAESLVKDGTPPARIRVDLSGQGATGQALAARVGVGLSMQNRRGR